MKTMRLCVFFVFGIISVINGCEVRVQMPKGKTYVVSQKDTETCFNIVKSEADWYQASNVCKKEGGHLVSIYSEKQLKFLVRSIKKYPDLVKWNFWIGLYQRKPRTLANYQWSDAVVSCDAHPSLSRKECSPVPGRRLDREQCLQHNCCWLESNTPTCFYSPVRARPVAYTKWTRMEKSTRNRKCAAISKSNNYEWLDTDCNKAYEHGFICQFTPPKSTPLTSDNGRYTTMWVIVAIVAVIAILCLIICICVTCFVCNCCK